MHRSALFCSLALLAGEENEGGQRSRGKMTSRGPLGINGEVRDGQSSDADDNSG